MKNRRNTILLTILALSLSTAAFAQENDEMGERGAKIKQMMQQKLKAMDKDGDGAISKQEFLDQAEKRFNKLDKNGDGKITQDELAAVKEGFKNRKANVKSEQFP
jgi:Ca2+-binding EF-hand superfamily protein